LRAIFGEGLCTFLFLFIVEATVVNNGRQSVPENLVLGCISTAFCSIALIYSFADVSGAHFNPAVTFATMVTKKTTVRKGLAYWGIQLIASVFATLALMIVFPRPTEAGTKHTIPEYVIVDIDSSAKYTHAFFMEVMLTFILVYVIFATAFDTVDTKNNIKIEADGSRTSEKKKTGQALTIYVNDLI
jgi:glycerol uptake facilitator-like aquaporin